MKRSNLAVAMLLLALCGGSLPLAAQPQSFVGARAVTSVSYKEVWQALADVGVQELRERTADPAFPSFGGMHSQGASLQATLHSCDREKEICRGVQLISVVPATTQRNAEIIVNSIELTAFSIDAGVIDIVNRPGSVAVMLSSYLVYDYGVSERLLAIALEQFHSVIGQTKRFMLQDDPAHAELWSRKD